MQDRGAWGLGILQSQETQLCSLSSSIFRCEQIQTRQICDTHLCIRSKPAYPCDAAEISVSVCPAQLVFPAKLLHTGPAGPFTCIKILRITRTTHLTFSPGPAWRAILLATVLTCRECRGPAEVKRRRSPQRQDASLKTSEQLELEVTKNSAESPTQRHLPS